MENLTLKAEKREIMGRALKASREEGKLPVVVYGPKTENTALFVNLGDFKKLWKKAGESTFIDLDIDGSKTPVLVQSVDVDPVFSEPVHVDFYAPDLTKKITASVPLVFEGEAPAMKLGGTLVKVFYELEVEAMAKDLPHEIKVDISKLENFEDKITISDLKLPEGVEVTSDDKEGAVALIEEVKEEEEAPVEAPSIEDIEVEKKGKKEEEGEAEEETPKEEKNSKEEK